MDLYDNIYIDNIQKTVVICLIIQTIFPFDAGSIVKFLIKKYPDVWRNVVHPDKGGKKFGGNRSVVD